MLQAGREEAVVWEHPEDPGLSLSKAENCPRTTLSPKQCARGKVQCLELVFPTGKR